MKYYDDLYYIEQIKQGDFRQFAILIDKYKSLAFNMIYRILKNREDAEEVAQDVFLSIYKIIKDFDERAKFSTLLYRIASNAAISKLREKKSFKFTNTVAMEEEITDIFEFEQVISEKISNLEQVEVKKIVNDLIELLNEEDRILISLYYFNDSDINEISAITGLTNSNVKVKIFRIRKKMLENLKQILGKEYEYWK